MVYMIFSWRTEFELNWIKQIICDKTDLPSQFWSLVENGSFYTLSKYKKGAFVYGNVKINGKALLTVIRAS